MVMKLASLLVLIAFLSSCGLFLGPLPEMSYLQKLEEPWEKIQLLDFNIPFDITSASYPHKLELYSLMDGNLRGTVGTVTSGSTRVLLIDFDQNNQVDTVVDESNNFYLNNNFSLYCDKTNYKIITKVFANDIILYENKVASFITSPNNPNTSAYHLSSMDEILFTDNSFNLNRSSLSSIALNPMYGSPLNGGHVYSVPDTYQIRYIYFYTNNGITNCFQIYDLKTGSDLLNEPILFLTQQRLNLFSKQDTLFYLDKSFLMKYDPSAKKFMVEKDFGSALNVNEMYLYDGLVTEENRVFFYSIPDNQFEKARLFYYNPERKNFVVNELDLNIDAILDADIYYDTLKRTLYFGAVYTNVDHFFSEAYKKQF